MGVHAYVIPYQLDPGGSDTLALILAHIGDNMKARFFGGEMNAGETARHAAVREMEEECGVRVLATDLKHEITLSVTSRAGWSSKNIFYSLQVPDIEKLRASATLASDSGREVMGVVTIPVPATSAPAFRQKAMQTVFSWPLDTGVRDALSHFLRHHHLARPSPTWGK